MKIWCKQCFTFFLHVSPAVFFFFRGRFYCFIGKVFSRSTKAVPWRCSAKKYLKYLAKLIRKHLYRSLFVSNVPGQGPVTLLKKELWLRCFPVNFGKVLKTPILLNISELRIYLCENVYPVEFLVTAYLTKQRLLWCSLNKRKKCTSLNKVSKTLEIYKKSPISLN